MNVLCGGCTYCIVSQKYDFFLLVPVPFDFPNTDFFFSFSLVGEEEKSGEIMSDILSFCLPRYLYLNQCSFLTNFLLQVFAINLLG